MRWTIALAVCCLCVMACNKEEAIIPTPERVWVAIAPTQCLTNPWERDWLESHGWDYSGYPKDLSTPELEEFEIIQDYYSRQGVDVSEAEATLWENIYVCSACSCPEGYTLYLLVRDEDVQQMLEFGYRVKSPD